MMYSKWFKPGQRLLSFNNFQNMRTFSTGINLRSLQNVISITQFQKGFLRDDAKLSDLKTFSFRDNDSSVCNVDSPIFYDFSGKKVYSTETPLKELGKSDFFVKSKTTNDLIAVLRDDPFDRVQGQSAEEDQITKECSKLNLSRQEQVILADYVNRFASQLLSTSFNQFDVQYVQTVNNKILSEISLNSKQKVVVYDALLNVLQKKMAHLEEAQKQIVDLIDKKETKYMKRFFGLVLTKVFILQYCTYVLLSWDIMEPITCLFGIFDLTVGYLYWLVNHSEFDYFNLKQRYLNKKKMTPENINILRQIEEICDLIDYVQQMKDLESPKLETILSDI